MQDSERRCRFSARPKSLTGQGVQLRSVTPQGSWETGTNPSIRPLKAVAWVQIPSGLQQETLALQGFLCVSGQEVGGPNPGLGPAWATCASADVNSWSVWVPLDTQIRCGTIVREYTKSV